MGASPSLLVDLRVAQTFRERGIQRYCQSLVLALARDDPALEIACLIDPGGDPPLRLEELAAHARILEGTASIADEGRPFTHFLQSSLDDARKPVTTLFPAELAAHRPRLGAIVYDMIPWLFSDTYFAQVGFARPYLRVLPALARLDRLFAISESTRRDVIAIANVDPARIVTIYGGLDEGRWPVAGALDRPVAAHPDSGDELLRFENDAGERFSVSRPYWLYVGGEDFRKNLLGLIEAAALVKQRGGLDAPLVVACHVKAERRAELLSHAATLGLSPGTDVILTGFVSDETLGSLLAGCLATVFPSTYEGLGLPVLESYAFGKPVIASDTSSLRELVPDSCRFDPYSAVSIADAMERLRDDPEVAEASLAFASHVMAMCTWSAAAHKVGEWLAEPAASTAASRPARSMWVATSLPPDAAEPGVLMQRGLAAPERPVTFFTPVPDRDALAVARQAVARARHGVQREAARAEVNPLSILAAARAVTPTKPVLFVLGDPADDQGTVAHLRVHGVGPGDAVLVNDVSSAASLVLEAGVRHVIVNSAAEADLLRIDLGEDGPNVRIDVVEAVLAQDSPWAYEARLRGLLELDRTTATGA